MEITGLSLNLSLSHLRRMELFQDLPSVSDAARGHTKRIRNAQQLMPLVTIAERKGIGKSFVKPKIGVETVEVPGSLRNVTAYIT